MKVTEIFVPARQGMASQFTAGGNQFAGGGGANAAWAALGGLLGIAGVNLGLPAPGCGGIVTIPLDLLTEVNPHPDSDGMNYVGKPTFGKLEGIIVGQVSVELHDLVIYVTGVFSVADTETYELVVITLGWYLVVDGGDIAIATRQQCRMDPGHFAVDAQSKADEEGSGLKGVVSGLRWKGPNIKTFASGNCAAKNTNIVGANVTVRAQWQVKKKPSPQDFTITGHATDLKIPTD